MTQKRKVGPGGGDFALNPNRFSGGGGGKSIVTGKKSTVSEKTRGPQKKMTKKRLEDATEKIYFHVKHFTTRTNDLEPL